MSRILIRQFSLFFLVVAHIQAIAIASDQKVSQIEVMALFKNKVMVYVDGKQYLLKAGEEEISGVKLIEATSKYATLEVKGKRGKYFLGSRVQANYNKTEKKQAQIYRDGNGMFKTTGSINDHTVDFLIDTGASMVALNSAIANRLGLQYRLKGEKTIVTTASGKELAYAIDLDQVRVGEITLRNIAAVVIEGEQPATPLLGMSFLGRLNINHEGQILNLEETL